VRCPNCQAENPAGNRFCEQCGVPLEQRCVACSAVLRAGARFCGACGAPVAAASAAAAAPVAASPATAPAPPSPVPRAPGYTPRHLAEKILSSRSALEGERRQVTVLFADVAGFTSLAERLDPEEVHEIMDRCFEIITAEVHRFEGTVNQYTGDGVMALFGAPIAHEDSPRRAVHAALGIQRALGEFGRELQTERGLNLRMRIGINTGPVVVGRIGDDLRMDYTAVGDTTNLAARMQQIARPGSVLVADAAHRLLGEYFETLDLGEVEVKGHRPVRAWEIVRARGRRARLDVTDERGLTPLVGREREVQTLLELYAEVKAGRGQVVHVVGEAGIGKSRLTLEFRRALARANESVTWLEGRCISFGQNIPFLPVIDQLRENFGVEEFDGEPEIIAKIEQGMRRMGQLESHIPFIRALLSVDPGDPVVSELEPLARRRKLLDAVRALSVRGAALRPIVFVVEDLHWIDASSEEYFGHLMNSLAGLPIMLILTYRVGYTPPFGTRSFQTVLNLRSLSEREMLAMAARVLGTDEFPEELKTALMDKAEGVPLFVEEVTKTLLDLGLLRRDERGGLVIAKQLSAANVPDTIQGIIMARLDRLGENGKRTVQLASVIGRQFLVRLLERIAGLTGQMEGLLGELKALEIIYEQGLLAEPAYIFKHAVIQDVAYNSLLRDRRRELHRAVALAIEELYPDRLNDHVEELAHHFSQGEDWAKAFEYLERSGDRAKYAYANPVALDFYARAIEAAERPRSPVDRRRLAAIHQKRSQVLLSMARPLDAVAESEKMLALARSTGDRAAEADALADMALAYTLTLNSQTVPEVRRCGDAVLAIANEIGDTRALARALGALATADQLEGNLTEGSRKYTEMLRLSEDGGFKVGAAQAKMWIGAHANWQGDFPGAIAMSHRAEAAGREARDDVSELVGLAFRCLSEIALGEYVAGQATIVEGLELARSRGNAFVEGRLINSLGWLHQELGDFAGALELDQQSAAIGVRIKNQNVEISALINVAFDHYHLGEPRRALEELQELAVRVDKFAVGAHRWRWSMHIGAYLAQVLLASGETAEALEQVERVLPTAQSTGSRKYIGRCHHLRGQIALAEGNAARAASELGDAVRIAREIEHPTLLWQAAIDHSSALAAIGRAEDAQVAARLALETIDGIAGRAPDAALRQSFVGWRAVQDAQARAARLLR
jgi:class 3 adenylate cyclase/tetratricopeptide (TPR) repeat protein